MSAAAGDKSVLERNVRLLLRRSYVPALPAPPFRDRLETLFLSEVERRAEAERRVRPAAPETRAPRFARPLRLAAALAAALLALFLGWRLFARGAGDARAQLLARGEVALGLPDGSWRAADGTERARGLDFPPPLLVVLTPEGAEFQVRLSAGSVHVGASSELRLEQRGGDVVCLLHGGAAWFQAGDERSELVPGVARALRAPEPGRSALLAGSSAPAPREALAPGASTTVPAPPTPARVLGGELVLPAGDAPPPAFRVALLAERLGNATPPPVVRDFASPDGTFRWPDPPAGKQRVFVHAPGYALCALGEFDLSGELPALRAELVPGVSLRGSVLDAHGNPVADALVIAEDETPCDGLLFSFALSSSELAFWLPIQARTGADGRFELAHLHPGLHTLRAGSPDFAPAWNDAVRVPRTSADELTLTLSPGGTVAGTVTREDGGPRAGAEIVIVAMDQVGRPRTSFDYARTDADGRYRFEHLPILTMIVVMMREDSGGERPEVRPVQIVEGASVTADFAAPRHGAHLHGRLLAHDGKPLARQNLGLFDAESASWNEDWVATTTEADGGYTFEGVVPGRYQFFLIDEMGRGVRCVDGFEVATGALDVEREVHVPNGRIGITVFDARGAVAGEPLEETALILMRADEDGGQSFSSFGLSDADGHFTFTDVRAGTYFVVAYPTLAGLGFAQSERVALAGDEPLELELELGLEAGVSAAVTVRDADGRGLEGAAVIFVDETGGEHTFSRLPMTDATGRYHANGLHPGRYRVKAQLAGYQGTPVEIRCELGHELEVPVVLLPSPVR